MKTFLTALLVVILSFALHGQDSTKSFPDVLPQISTPSCQVAAADQSALFRDSAVAGHFALASKIDWSKSGMDKAVQLQENTAYVILLTEWHADGNAFTLNASSWYMFKSDGERLTQAYAKDSSDKALLPYGYQSVVVLGIQLIDPPQKAGTTLEIPAEEQEEVPEEIQQMEDDLQTVGGSVSFAYAISVTQGQQENYQHLGEILGQLAGASSITYEERTGKKVSVAYPTPVCVEEVDVTGIDKLPVDVGVTFTLTPGEKATIPDLSKSPSGPISCTNSEQACVIARTFGDVDKEPWDVDLGVSIPGVREASFSLDDKTSKVTKSVTHHVDLYAFISVYPGYLWYRKDSYAPRIELGVPVASQPLHRPFFGAAEQLPRPITNKIFKVPISFYGGVVRLIEPQLLNGLQEGQVTDATTFANDLHKKHVVWKGMFGVTFPVESLLSKVSLGGGGK